MRLLSRAAFFAPPLWAGSMALAHASPPVMTWETAVDGGCRVRPAQLAREVDLACDSVGKTCRRVERGGTARAVLACNDASAWTVEARDANGAHLWTLAIDGARESRVRIAAMWIARAQRDAPPPDANVIAAAPSAPPKREPDAAPIEAPKSEIAKSDSAKAEAAKNEPAKNEPVKREPAKEIAKNAAATPAPAKSESGESSKSSVPVAREANGSSVPRDRASDASSADGYGAAQGRGGIAALASGTLSSGVAAQAIGAGAHVAFALPLALNAGLSLAASRTLGATTSYGMTTGRAGAILGWGAPWSAGILGASIEAGALVGSVDAQSSVSPNARTFGVPYAELALIAAVPTRRAFRPWIALSFTGLASPIRVTESGRAVASSTQATAGLDVGLAWAAW